MLQTIKDPELGLVHIFTCDFCKQERQSLCTDNKFTATDVLIDYFNWSLTTSNDTYYQCSKCKNKKSKKTKVYILKHDDFIEGVFTSEEAPLKIMNTHYEETQTDNQYYNIEEYEVQD